MSTVLSTSGTFFVWAAIALLAWLVAILATWRHEYRALVARTTPSHSHPHERWIA